MPPPSNRFLPNRIGFLGEFIPGSAGEMVVLTAEIAARRARGMALRHKSSGQAETHGRRKRSIQDINGLVCNPFLMFHPLLPMA